MARPKDPVKEQALLDAALAIILKEGLTGLRMQDLAKAAGLGTGTAYVYFSDKTELLNRLFAHVKSRSTARYLKHYDPGAPFMANFKRIWSDYLQQALKYPQDLAFIEQYKRSPYLKKRTVEEGDQLLLPIVELLERGKREHLVRNVPTNLLIAQLSGSIEALVEYHLAGAVKLTPAARDIAYRMAWDSIRA